MADGRSRVSRLASSIERELAEEFGPWTSRLQARRARMAARYQALAEQTAATIGRDPKSTKRSLTALQKAADGQVAALRAMGNGHKKGLDLSARLAQMKEGE